MRKRLEVLTFGDSARLCAAIGKMLAALEVELVQTAFTSAEVTRALKERSYDFVLVGDVTDGSKAERMIRAVRRSAEHDNQGIPVLALLEPWNTDSIALAKKAGADEVLCAPISWQELAEAIVNKAARRRGKVSTFAALSPRLEAEQAYRQ